MANPLENVCEKLAHIHMVVHTWWCWHICKEDEVGVDVDQLGEGTEARVRTPLAECLPVEFGQSDGRKDSVSQSGPDAGHMVTGR